MYLFNKKVIEEFLKNNNLTLKKFCKNCDISVKTLDKYLNTDCGKCRIEIIYKILKYTKWKIDDLIIHNKK